MRDHVHPGSGHKGCHGGHCSHDASSQTGTAVRTDESHDVEHGPSSFERVILTIDGLKCGCCESSISKAILRISAIKDPHVNVVLSRVEFVLDTSRTSVAEVIKRLSASTGYAFEEYTQPDGLVLELLVNNPDPICHGRKPNGVTVVDQKAKLGWSASRVFGGRNSIIPPANSASPVGLSPKTSHDTTAAEVDEVTTTPFSQFTVRVHYDATKAGAREIIEFYRQHTGLNVQLSPPTAHPSLGSKHTTRACILFLIAFVLTVPVLLFAWTPVYQKLKFAHASLVLASVIQLVAMLEFLPGAVRSLVRYGLFETDFLIALSSTTAYVFSVVSYVSQIRGHPLETGFFFETSSLLVTLVLLGRVINEFARLRAAKSVSFRSLQVDDALLVVGTNFGFPETEKIDARLLQYGDYFKVPPHTRIVTDGTVVHGGSVVDESMITGESLPVAKGIGSKVYAGTNNGGGTLIVALKALPHENSVSRIATMVEKAESTKPTAQALADRVASWFVPAMAAIGLTVFLIWLFVDHYVHHHSMPTAVVKALTYAIATLIVSCPCAIGLAVPMVVLIAGGISARFGIVFRDLQKLEVARNVTDVVFDKTGTLTCGVLRVEKVEFEGADPEHIRGLKAMLLGLLKDEKHPVAAAVFDWASRDSLFHSSPQIRPVEMLDIKSIPGWGVVGTCKDTKLKVRAGNPRWLGTQFQESEHTVLSVTISDMLCATFRLRDRLRHTAKLTTERLKTRGIAVHMLSGDTHGAVKQTACQLNIHRWNTQAQLRPDDKQQYVQDLQAQGKTVMFVGDGTNDAVALKQAHIGVQLHCGSDVAQSAADVVLMTEQLHSILILLDIARGAYCRIVLNFAWSALYNVIAVLMAAGAFVRVRIPPAWAGLGELVSVLPVVCVAFQMKWRNYGREYRGREWDDVETVDVVGEK